MRSPSIDTAGAPLSAVPAIARRERQPAGTRPVGGLRMTQDPFTHRPVMATEVVAALRPVPDGLAIDATVGGGGHASALLDAHPGLRLLGIDRDPQALAAAAVTLAPGVGAGRVTLVQGRFDHLATMVPAAWADVPVTAVLMDLGVSSPQLDRGERGFSYRRPGPLDMRMGPDAPITAADVVNGYDEGRLAALFRDNGEGRFAHRVARAVVAARPVVGTVELAEVVRAAIPAAARRTGGHPATRFFQAIRVEVNGELDALRGALDAALPMLAPGGRLAVLSYHSGEDRIVKAAFVAAASGGCVCPPGLPCVCGARPVHRLVFRGSRRPAAGEVAANRRAQSARLRVIERTSATPESASGTPGRDA
jgi:16S rRNA (cytosine1402-N4)-methyltransferase